MARRKISYLNPNAAPGDTRGIAPNAFADILAQRSSANTLNPNAAPGDTRGVKPVNQSLADAYAAQNPTWTPPDAIQAQLPNPIIPLTAVNFDPLLDPGYAAAYSAVGNANQHAQAEHDYQYGRGQQVYGVNYNGDVLGDKSGGYNPYSQAAILKRNYVNSVRGTTNSYASSGQLYSGALKNAQAGNDLRYGQNFDQLKRAASDFYHGQDQTVQNVADQGVSQLAGLLGPALANFLQQQRGS